ncbi:MAG TPA: hypothetical protein VIT92_00890, partial [Burkholderiaceae bacterium]
MHGAAHAQQAPRAIWTWEHESYAMLEQRAAADAAIAFLRAHGIQTVYLYADAYKARNLLVSHPEQYRALIRRLRLAGIRTYALLGSAYLNTERYILPNRRADALAMVQRVLTYNAAAPVEERFDGINLDIEPHILDEWDKDKYALLEHFLDMSADLMELKRKYGQTLQVGPAIPFWWDGIQLEWRGRRRPVSEHAQDIYDYVALMDYRDRAEGQDGIIAHALDELAYGKLIGKPVLLGVETTPNEIQKVSFHHLKEADMERELGIAERALRPQPAFGGFVIHHYRGYRDWLER